MDDFNTKDYMDKYEIKRLTLFWFLFALTISLFIGFAIHLFSHYAGFSGFYPLASGADDTLYDSCGIQMMLLGKIETAPSWYPYIVGFIYMVMGKNIGFVFGKILNVIFRAFTVFLAVKMVGELSEDCNIKEMKRRINFTGFLTSLYPAHLFYSTQLLKDSIIILLIMCSLYYALKSLRNKKYIKNYIILFIFLVVLSKFRIYATLAIIVAYIGYLIFLNSFDKKFILPLLALIIFIGLGLAAAGFGFMGINFLRYWNPDTISAFRESTYSIGGAAAGIQIDFTSPIKFLLTYSYSLITVIFGPLPWQFRSATHLIALPEAIILWCSIPIIIRQLTCLKKNRPENLLLVFCFCLAGIVALFSDNIGANTRLRMGVIIPLIVYMSLKIKIYKISL